MLRLAAHAHTMRTHIYDIYIFIYLVYVLNPFADSFIIHHIKCFITRCLSRSLRPDSNPITVIKSHPYENCIITAHTHAEFMDSLSSYAQVYKHIKYNLLNVNPERNF